ncbi:hypothetical protein ACFSR7_27665 [Cohnella sp. GCM10020058]|uniref:hypothetical protein n=1 Tax=Cohnella sp. GCM10020058 TaxID=3317330 RepID=UPI00363BC806
MRDQTSFSGLTGISTCRPTASVYVRVAAAEAGDAAALDAMSVDPAEEDGAGADGEAAAEDAAVYRMPARRTMDN